ncbi:Eukaryotic translation initiation factor isoform 4G-1 [Gracilariopsis chorda]|uniref:Eukaryotic translation initiation factor isoform 4G-1 n=1 Tax=Gracilariopsis chorda TaxID=448386 RepID=A0A2V3IH35_9FLOR|nr:Eukaryotic translation initiation factor isoform 4G-1 [Gracilariopsis chorda]|eukprot:PXF41405.1 Eukaryotic translation initiation factor isoform 4G-1 [Gracilariopsis chorda]
MRVASVKPWLVPSAIFTCETIKGELLVYHEVSFFKQKKPFLFWLWTEGKRCYPSRLLKLGIESKEEDVLEALCKLVSKTGAKISTNPGASKVINEYFCRFDYLSRDFTLPARIRFMIQDLVDQRANGWKVRRQKTSAKTIAEIHKQAKEEERKKHEAQQAARERRGRGGMGSRDRAPQGFVPRMTMPSEPRSTSGQTRLDRTLERQPSRSLSGISGGFSVSLRPGTSASRVGSLRPGGSSFGSFGVLSDKDASGATQAADPRRVKSTFWQPVSRRPQHQVAPKAPTPKSALMDPQVLKRKAKGAMEEYWSNPSVSEVQEILADEVKAPNYKGFVHEALMATFSSKITHQEKSIELFAGLVDSPIEGTIFCECFSKLVRKLSDMEIDNPRCGEFLGRFIGATAATSKLDPSNRKDFGLKFLGRDLQEVEDPKRRANLAVHTFAELSGRLSASVPDEKEREDMVRQVAERLHIDLAADMCLWNPMRGLSKLSDMLSQNNISFLVPYLALEGQLKELIESKAPGEKIENLLRSNSKTADTSLMRVIVRVGLDCLFMSSADTIVESFKRYVGSPVIKVYGTLPRELQFSILLAAQVYIGRSVNFLPPLSDASSKHGGLALQALHDSGMVESTVLLRWKKDTGESQEVACKNEMVEQTERFFERLAK